MWMGSVDILLFIFVIYVSVQIILAASLDTLKGCKIKFLKGELSANSNRITSKYRCCEADVESHYSYFKTRVRGNEYEHVTHSQFFNEIISLPSLNLKIKCSRRI
jgi:hypothetical protein